MNVFTMVVWVVTVVMIAKVLAARYESRKASGMELDQETRSQLARLDELEQRVQVLEAIVTDRNYELRRELDDLDRVS